MPADPAFGQQVFVLGQHDLFKRILQRLLCFGAERGKVFDMVEELVQEFENKKFRLATSC